MLNLASGFAVALHPAKCLHCGEQVVSRHSEWLMSAYAERNWEAIMYLFQRAVKRTASWRRSLDVGQTASGWLTAVNRSVSIGSTWHCSMREADHYKHSCHVWLKPFPCVSLQDCVHAPRSVGRPFLPLHPVLRWGRQSGPRMVSALPSRLTHHTACRACWESAALYRLAGRCQ